MVFEGRLSKILKPQNRGRREVERPGINTIKKQDLMCAYTSKSRDRQHMSKASDVRGQNSLWAPLSLRYDHSGSIAHSEWQTLAQNSFRVQLKSLQATADNSMPARQAAQLQAMADDYALQQQPIIHKKPASSAGLPSAKSYPLAPVQSPGASLTQRKVYVGTGDEIQEKDRKTTFLATVIHWIGDDIHRHFVNEGELENYRTKKTNYIGTVGPRNSWVRLNVNDGLLVVGEIHNKTTMDQMAKALYNYHYIDEGYNYLPDERAEEFPGLKDYTKNQEEDKALELIFPKLAHSLLLIIKFHKLWFFPHPGSSLYNHWDQLMTFTFLEGLFMAKDVHEKTVPDPPPARVALSEEWRRKSTIWGSTIDKIRHDEKKLTNIMQERVSGITSTDVLRMARLLLNFLLEDYASHPVPEATDEATNSRITHVKKGMRRLFPRYRTAENEMMSWREAYMLKQIRKAKKENYLLAGLGEAHRQNLKDILDKDGIKHIFMEMLLDNADKDNKANAAKARKNT